MTQRKSRRSNRRRYITWLGDYTHGVQSWWVRLNRQQLHRGFSIRQYGTKTKALAAAIRWRDRTLRQPGIFARQGYMVRNRRNSSGTVGITRSRVVKIISGKRRVYWGWSAYWMDGDGYQIKRTWSIKKYGERKAHALAKLARQRAIIQINKKRRYT